VYGDGMNWYEYCGSCPANYTDAMGLALASTMTPSGIMILLDYYTIEDVAIMAGITVIEVMKIAKQSQPRTIPKPTRPSQPTHPRTDPNPRPTNPPTNSKPWPTEPKPTTPKPTTPEPKSVPRTDPAAPFPVPKPEKKEPKCEKCSEPPYAEFIKCDDLIADGYSPGTHNTWQFRALTYIGQGSIYGAEVKESSITCRGKSDKQDNVHPGKHISYYMLNPVKGPNGDWNANRHATLIECPCCEDTPRGVVLPWVFKLVQSPE